MRKSFRRRRPSPATAIALVALAVAVGGVAVAAPPSSSEERIYACAGTDKVLRLSSADAKCGGPSGATLLSWHKAGVPGYSRQTKESKIPADRRKGTAVLNCPAGHKVLGGGAGIRGSKTASMRVSQPERGASRDRWRAVAVRSKQSHTWYLRVTVICAKVD